MNGYLAFKYCTDKELTLREFTYSVALGMCAKQVEEEDSARRRGRQPRLSPVGGGASPPPTHTHAIRRPQAAGAEFTPLPPGGAQLITPCPG